MAIRKALIVDDSRVARFTLAKLLKSRGITVDTADSGPEAIEYLKTTQPDVVFMDFMMPDMNGLEATRAITANPETASVPVVFCTGNDTAEDRKQAKDHGASDFLTKSRSEEEIDGVLASVEQIPQPQAATVAANDEPTVDAKTDANSFEQIVERTTESAKRIASEVAKDAFMKLASSNERSLADAVQQAREASLSAIEKLRGEMETHNAATPADQDAQSERAAAQAREVAESVIRENRESMRRVIADQLKASEQKTAKFLEDSVESALNGAREDTLRAIDGSITKLRNELRAEVVSSVQDQRRATAEAIERALQSAPSSDNTRDTAKKIVRDVVENSRVKLAELAASVAEEKANQVAEKTVESIAKRIVEDKVRSTAIAAAEEVTFNTVETARDVSLEEMREFRQDLVSMLDKRMRERMSGDALRNVVADVARVEADRVSSQTAERIAEHVGRKLVEDALSKQATVSEARAQGLYRRTALLSLAVLIAALLSNFSTFFL